MLPYKAITAAELGITNEAITKLENLRFFDVREVPEIRIYGLWNPRGDNPFVRMPTEVAKTVSKNVYDLHFHTAGGRLRFVTTSPYVALKTTAAGPEPYTNMAITGHAGFDLYVKKNGKYSYKGLFRPPFSYEHGFDGIVQLGRGTHEVTINFPLYHKVTDLYIGFDQNSELSLHPDYTIEKPVLYYGSSITQGGCACRPGMAYQALISKRLDCNFTNLGFSGSARAEDTMIDYLSTLDCSVFVLDYDHNAPNPEHLKNTHEKLYLAFRKTHPETPVIMVTKPDFWSTPDDFDRRDVIYTTYQNARARGEKVLFVDGYSLFAGELRDECTVDGCHPNDLGMARMADVIGKTVELALTM